MAEQNFKSHTRWVPLYHFVTSTAILIPFVLSIIYFFKAVAEGSGRLHGALMILFIAGLLLTFWYARFFALKAQDRAIRAEENFRYYIATGKPFDSRLRMGQIIALRFAGDDEFVALAKKAVDENLSAKQIKMAVTNWKTDNDRA
jgi:uncharacterized membrane protein YciS (DUF1049 family)